MTPAVFEIPELVVETALRIIDAGDLSAFSRSNSVIRSLTNPLLYREIDVSYIEQISVIAQNFGSNHALARVCQRIHLRDPYIEGGEILHIEESALEQHYDDLALILEIVHEQQAPLRAFVWERDSWESEETPVPARLWCAVRALAPVLQELELVFTKADEKTWMQFTATEYVHLKRLTVDMCNTYGWESSDLQTMLNALPRLEYLDLSLSSCPSCGPLGLNLECTLPNLRRFRLNAGGIPEGAQTFLARHPQLVEIDLSCEGRFTFTRGDLPVLRALRISQDTLSALTKVDTELGGWLGVPYVHVVTWAFPTVTAAASPARAFMSSGAAHLRCLVIEASWYTEGEGLQELLADLPELVEFGLVLGSQDQQPPLGEEDLVKIVSWTRRAGCPKLLALRIKGPESKPLSEGLLADLGTDPPKSLQYICWVVQGIPTTYRLEREKREEEEITSLVKITSMRAQTTGRWFSNNSVLDHPRL